MNATLGAARMLLKHAAWTMLALDRRLARSYLAASGPRLLQVGGGGRRLEGWLNTDLNPIRGGMRLDATRRYPFADASFDFIFSEQLIEHLDYARGCRMLAECRRVLRPGGTLRLATPDLRFLVRLFEGAPWSGVESRYVLWTLRASMPEAPFPAAAFVLNNDVRNWGHRFLYDEEVLADALERAGFGGVRRQAPGESRHPPLRGLEQSATLPADLLQHSSLVLEADRSL